jgi:L-alanine-DL-glutamate epimerase-like enolase superfamily enzyme
MTPEVSALPVHLVRPFRIAHGTSTVRTNVLVRLGEAFGEAGLPPYLGTTVDDVVEWMKGVSLPDLPDEGPIPLEHILEGLPPGPPAARCALDMALHDLWGRRLGYPLYTLFGLDPRCSPVSFVTLSIPEDLGELARDAASFGPHDRLKLKVGTGSPERDLEVVWTARRATEALIAVDANGAWSRDEAVDVLPALLEAGVSIVEQPIAAGDPDDWHRLRRALGTARTPALFADESVFTVDDLLALAGAADGINVKLAKAGGIGPARVLIAMARALDLQVLLGCMIESSLAIAAAAHLAPLVDFADLDAPLLVRDDPFHGVEIRDGRVLPTARPGIGAEPA